MHFNRCNTCETNVILRKFIFFAHHCIYDQIGVGESATIDDIVEVMNEQDGCESEEEDREMEVKLMM
jgi:hypothetical protein